MTDYFHIELTEQEIGAVSNLGLAHLGDCVYELLVRSYLICGGKLTNSQLHRETVRYVSAEAQAKAVEKLFPELTEQERTVYRRGRNTRVNSVPKHAELSVYHSATGLECLFGWLYLHGRQERINELFSLVIREG